MVDEVVVRLAVMDKFKLPDEAALENKITNVVEALGISREQALQFLLIVRRDESPIIHIPIPPPDPSGTIELWPTRPFSEDVRTVARGILWLLRLPFRLPSAWRRSSAT